MPASADSPRAVADKTEFNFGTMDVASDGLHAFEIKNLGTANLELTAGSTSCGCTGLEVPRDPVLPGRSAWVEVHWKSKGAMGPFEQTATILTNDREIPRSG